MGDIVLKDFYDSIRTWTTSTFEAELTEESISLLDNYVDTLNGDGSQITQAIRNTLASEGYCPIRNAYQIHELFEAKTFAERGFDYRKGWRTPGLKSAFDEDISVHLAATIKRCTYLQSVAADRGIAVAVGTLVRLDFGSDRSHHDRIVAETELLHDPITEPAAVRFLADLYSDVPNFFGLLNESLACNSYLIRRYGQVIQESLESRGS